MVVGMSRYSQIREAYTSGASQRSIAGRLRVSRQTVKKYCEGAAMPPRPKAVVQLCGLVRSRWLW